MPVDLVIEEHDSAPSVLGGAPGVGGAMGGGVCGGGGGGGKPSRAHSPDSPGLIDHEQVGDID